MIIGWLLQSRNFLTNNNKNNESLLNFLLNANYGLKTTSRLLFVVSSLTSTEAPASNAPFFAHAAAGNIFPNFSQIPLWNRFPKAQKNYFSA